LEQCVRERWTKRELNRQIDSALYERSKVGTPKLSPVLREIAPQAEQIFRDQYVMEFLGGKEYEHENSMKAALVVSVILIKLCH
jgi:predicted nuclease of restriction endonuclease-like (RecB) superfamily